MTKFNSIKRKINKRTRKGDSVTSVPSLSSATSDPSIPLWSDVPPCSTSLQSNIPVSESTKQRKITQTEKNKKKKIQFYTHISVITNFFFPTPYTEGSIFLLLKSSLLIVLIVYISTQKLLHN